MTSFVANELKIALINKNKSCYFTILKVEIYINPIQDGGGEPKMPPTSFSPVTSANVGISPQNFLTFSFNPFCHTGVKFQVFT